MHFNSNSIVSSRIKHTYRKQRSLITCFSFPHLCIFCPFLPQVNRHAYHPMKEINNNVDFSCRVNLLIWQRRPLQIPVIQIILMHNEGQFKSAFKAGHHTTWLYFCSLITDKRHTHLSTYAHSGMLYNNVFFYSFQLITKVKSSEFHVKLWILRFILDFKARIRVQSEPRKTNPWRALLFMKLERWASSLTHSLWSLLDLQRSPAVTDQKGAEASEPRPASPLLSGHICNTTWELNTNQRRFVVYSPASRSLPERCSVAERSELWNKR